MPRYIRNRGIRNERLKCCYYISSLQVLASMPEIINYCTHGVHKVTGNLFLVFYKKLSNAFERTGIRNQAAIKEPKLSSILKKNQKRNRRKKTGTGGFHRTIRFSVFFNIWKFFLLHPEKLKNEDHFEKTKFFSNKLNLCVRKKSFFSKWFLFLTFFSGASLICAQHDVYIFFLRFFNF